MFPELPPLEKPSSEEGYDEFLGRIRRAADLDRAKAGAQLSGIPAGYTYFGQFLAHDITFNPVSHLTHLRDPESLISFRSPRLDLDSLYGRGPKDSPYFYQPPADTRPAGRLSVGWGLGYGEDDLPRTGYLPAVALIGDARNDENTIISQLHLAFIKLHNRFFGDTDGDFDLAAKLTRWHYQWVILNDYLGRVCGESVVEQIWPKAKREAGIKPELRWFTWKLSPYIPLEFAGAAFRFGHSMVRDEYQLNHWKRAPVFSRELSDLRGFERLRAQWTVQWDQFLKFDDAVNDAAFRQQSHLIDLSLSLSLSDLPPDLVGTKAGEHDEAKTNLLRRNIDRGFQLSLPSGQDVARAMAMEPLEGVSARGDPLWVYVLREAKRNERGKRLGRVGSTIVAETIIGLIAGDPLSYVNVDPRWKPSFPPHEKFELRDLIREAGMPITKADLERTPSFSRFAYDPRGALLRKMHEYDERVRAASRRA